MGEWGGERGREERQVSIVSKQALDIGAQPQRGLWDTLELSHPMGRSWGIDPPTHTFRGKRAVPRDVNPLLHGRTTVREQSHTPAT